MKRQLLPTLLLLLACDTALGAVTFVVNTTQDDHDWSSGDDVCNTGQVGVCSLRAAVEQANWSGDATIVIPAGTYTLRHGGFSVTKSMRITGAGSEATAIVATAESGFFYVWEPTPGSGVVLTLEDVTLRDLNITTTADGAINAEATGSVVMHRCVVTNCVSRGSPAIRSAGSVDVSDSVFSHNRGAMCCYRSGAINLVSNAQKNKTAKFTRCTFLDNASPAEGGALFVDGSYGTVNVENCTFTGNHTGSHGGAIRLGGTSGSTLELDHVTMTGNSAGAVSGGGGLSSASPAAATQIFNSILAANTDVAIVNQQSVVVPGDCAGAMTSAHACNMLGPDGTGHCAITGTFTAASPQLGPLQDNGGWTPTMALLAGSAGIDFPACAAGSFPTTDQRGVQRAGASPDLGAYERVPCGDSNGDGEVSVADVLFLINTLFADGPLPPGLADVNEDGVRSVADILSLLNALFAGGPPPVCPGT